jgi:hypothetical protein
MEGGGFRKLGNERFLAAIGTALLLGWERIPETGDN